MDSLGVSWRERIGWLVLATATMAVAGCGASTHPVEGRVEFTDGKPATELAGGSVVFESLDAKMSAVGEIQPDATFRMMTHKPGDGVIAGKHRVLVAAPRPQAAVEGTPLPPPIIDPRFESLETSGIEVTVEPGQKEIVIRVERAKPRR